MKKITLFMLFVFLAWGAMAYATNVKITYKVEVDGWTSANPNTHFGGITLTCNEVPNSIILTTLHLTENEISIDLSADVNLSFTRKYRGFDFVGFSIGRTDLGQSPTLTAKQKKQLVKGTPLVALYSGVNGAAISNSQRQLEKILNLVEIDKWYLSLPYFSYKAQNLE